MKDIVKNKIKDAEDLVKEIINKPDLSSKIQRDKLIKAISLYNESIKIFPTAEAYLALAYIFLTYDDINSSCIYLVEALSIEPENSQAKQMLEYIKIKYSTGDKISESNKLVNKIESNVKISSVKSKLINSFTKKGLSGDNDFFSLLSQARK